jgi:uncharacterized membrane protein
MYGSGVMIGMMAIIIKTVPGIIPRDLILANIPFCVVVVGTATLSAAVLLVAIGTIAVTVSSSAYFVFLGLLNGLIFFLLHFYPVKYASHLPKSNSTGQGPWNSLGLFHRVSGK